MACPTATKGIDAVQTGRRAAHAISQAAHPPRARRVHLQRARRCYTWIGAPTGPSARSFSALDAHSPPGLLVWGKPGRGPPRGAPASVPAPRHGSTTSPTLHLLEGRPKKQDLHHELIRPQIRHQAPLRSPRRRWVLMPSRPWGSTRPCISTTVEQAPGVTTASRCSTGFAPWPQPTCPGNR